VSNKTMNCRQVKRLLPPSLDEELSGRVRDNVTTHLASCPACRSELEALKADIGLLELAGAPEVTPFLATRVLAEIRQRKAALVRRGFRPGWVLGAVGATMLIALSLGVGTLVGSGLAQGRAGAAGDDIFTTATADPSLETYQSLLGGE
jgi:predicted anti-sigma-YlaC factor YlaD